MDRCQGEIFPRSTSADYRDYQPRQTDGNYPGEAINGSSLHSLTNLLTSVVPPGIRTIQSWNDRKSPVGGVFLVVPVAAVCDFEAAVLLCNHFNVVRSRFVRVGDELLG
jgi:hypothetical protein